jgi:hypothetical protein
MLLLRLKICMKPIDVIDQPFSERENTPYPPPYRESAMTRKAL